MKLISHLSLFFSFCQWALLLGVIIFYFSMNCSFNRITPDLSVRTLDDNGFWINRFKPMHFRWASHGTHQYTLKLMKNPCGNNMFDYDQTIVTRGSNENNAIFQSIQFFLPSTWHLTMIEKNNNFRYQFVCVVRRQTRGWHIYSNRLLYLYAF